MKYFPLISVLVFLTFFFTARRLVNGIYILIMVLPFLGMFTTEKFGITLKLSDFVAVTCLFFFWLNFLLKPKMNLFSMPLVKLLGIFVLFNIISFLFHYPYVMGLSREGGLNSPALASIKVTFWCIYSVLIAIMVCYTIEDKESLRRCVLILLMVTVLVCIYSLIGLLGYILRVRAITWRLVGRAGGFVGLRGTFDEPSYFAHYMALVMPLALMFFILRRQNENFLIPPLAGFIIFVTNFLILSAAGLVGTVFILLFIPYCIHHFGLLTARETVRLFIISFIVIFILFIAGVSFNLNFFEIIKANIEKIFNPYSTRGAGQILAYKIFRKHPIIGLGPGNWTRHFIALIPPEIRGRATAPSYNNLYMEILLDVGLIGFIPFLWIFISLFRNLARAIRKTEDRFLQAVLVSFIVGFMALLIEYYACFNFYRIYVWVPLGIAMAAIRLANEESEEGYG